MSEFGRVLVVDRKGSGFLTQAENKLKPLCSHYEVITTLKDTWEKIEEQPKPEFDVVLLDFTLMLVGDERRELLARPEPLPVWRDKFEPTGKLKLLKEMKHRWPDTKIALMMNYSAEAQLPDGIKLGGDKSINKNLPWGRILQNLSELLITR